VKNRFAQLTYTSFEPLDGSRGGWQIKEASPDLSAAERELALANVPAEMRLVKPLSKYPTAEETGTLPLRLLYLPPDSGPAMFVHSCPAGRDGSGREGNVFTHVLVDRDVWAMQGGQEVYRSIQMWRSPRWLTPFDVSNVQAARIAEELPPTPGGDTRTRVAEFICARPERALGLGALLDATMLAIEGGPPVVIIADDVDEGVAWIAAVTMLAGTEPAVSISFSTLESSVDLRTRGPKAALSVLLRGEARVASLPASVVAVDPTRQGRPSSGLWIPVAGDSFPQMSWSKLVSPVVAAGADVLADRMLAVDELSRNNSGLNVTAPDWALALAVAEEPRLADQWETHVDVIVKGTPIGDLPADTRGTVQTLLLHHLPTSSSLLRLLGAAAAAPTNEIILIALYSTYIRGLLSRPETLMAAERPPIPQCAELSRADMADQILAELSADLAEVAERARQDELGPVMALRALDIILWAGVGYDSSQPALARLLLQGLDGIESPQGETIIEAVGLVSEALRDAVAEARVGSPRKPVLVSPVTKRVGSSTFPDGPSHLDKPRILEAVAALAEEPEISLSPRDWTWSVLRHTGNGTPWSVEALVALAEAIGSRAHVDLTAEACSALLDAGLRDPSARLAQLMVEHNEAECRWIDDYQSDLLWLGRVLGDEHWWGRVRDYRTAARVLSLGLAIGLDRNHVEHDQWMQWAPSLVIAGAWLVTLPPVHLYYPEVASMLAGIDVMTPLSRVIQESGSQITERLAALIATVSEVAQALTVTIWRLSEGLAVRAAVAPDLLLLEVDLDSGRTSVGEGAVALVMSRDPSTHRWLLETVVPAADPEDRPALARWLNDIATRVEMAATGPASTRERIT
jgi:hypothetical protein